MQKAETENKTATNIVSMTKALRIRVVGLALSLVTSMPGRWHALHSPLLLFTVGATHYCAHVPERHTHTQTHRPAHPPARPPARQHTQSDTTFAG